MAIRQGQRSCGSRRRSARSPAQAGRNLSRRRRRRGGGSDQGLSGGLTASALVILALVWASFGFYRVDAAERGVEFRFGAFQGLTSPGLAVAFAMADRERRKDQHRRHGAAELSRQHAHEGREHRQRRAGRAVPAHGSAELLVQPAQSGDDARSGNRERHSRGDRPQRARLHPDRGTCRGLAAGSGSPASDARFVRRRDHHLRGEPGQCRVPGRGRGGGPGLDPGARRSRAAHSRGANLLERDPAASAR